MKPERKLARHSTRRRLAAALLVALAAAALIGVARAYLQPGLRQAIVFSGFGLC